MRPRTTFRKLAVTTLSMAWWGVLHATGALAADAARSESKSATIKPDVLYHNYCSVCHGDRGDGRSRAQKSLNPPPRDFTSAGDLSREAMIIFITHGKPGTAMAAWNTQLSDAEIASVTDYIREKFMVVALDPKLQLGRNVYVRNCAVCHGERGQGSNLPVGGSAPPKNLASPQSRAELNRGRMIASVTQGRPGTAMPAFGPRLPASDIEAVVDYVRAALMVPETSISGTHAHGGRAGDRVPAPALSQIDLSAPMPEKLKGNKSKGKRFYNDNCATCHGVKGDGKGPRAYFINPKPKSFIALEFQTRFNRPAIYAATSMGKFGTEMPAWSKVLSPQEIANVSEYVFQEFVMPAHKKAASGK